MAAKKEQMIREATKDDATKQFLALQQLHNVRIGDLSSLGVGKRPGVVERPAQQTARVGVDAMTGLQAVEAKGSLARFAGAFASTDRVLNANVANLALALDVTQTRIAKVAQNNRKLQAAGVLQPEDVDKLGALGGQAGALQRLQFGLSKQGGALSPEQQQAFDPLVSELRDLNKHLRESPKLTAEEQQVVNDRIGDILKFLSQTVAGNVPTEAERRPGPRMGPGPEARNWWEVPGGGNAGGVYRGPGEGIYAKEATDANTEEVKKGNEKLDELNQNMKTLVEIASGKKAFANATASAFAFRSAMQVQAMANGQNVNARGGKP
jgi:hypothetical protein